MRISSTYTSTYVQDPLLACLPSAVIFYFDLSLSSGSSTHFLNRYASNSHLIHPSVFRFFSKFGYHALGLCFSPHSARSSLAAFVLPGMPRGHRVYTSSCRVAFVKAEPTSICFSCRFHFTDILNGILRVSSLQVGANVTL